MARILVVDEESIETPALLVAVDEEGRVIAQDTVIIGGGG
jgi:hypothetical protein